MGILLKLNKLTQRMEKTQLICCKKLNEKTKTNNILFCNLCMHFRHFSRFVYIIRMTDLHIKPEVNYIKKMRGHVRLTGGKQKPE